MVLQVLLALLGSSQPEPSTPPSPDGLDVGEVSSFTQATAGWREDPALDLGEAVTRNKFAPIFVTLDKGICVDIGPWASTEENAVNHVWVYCPPAPEGSMTSGPCQKLISRETDPAVLGERCPRAAVAFLALARASCAEEHRDFESHLRGSSSMRTHVPKVQDKKLQEFRRSVKSSRGVLQGEPIGCAETVTSPDGRMRAWHLRGGESGNGPAYLQWLTPEGKLGLLRDGARENLYLDNVLDGITPIPGKPHEYLVTGYRLLGSDFLRFAEVITLEGEHPKRVKGRFLVNGEKEDVLVVTGGIPETGKPRHSPVTTHWLRLKGQALWGEPIPGEEQFLRRWKPFVMGEWTGEFFAMTEGGWARFLKLRGTRVIPSGR